MMAQINLRGEVQAPFDMSGGTRQSERDADGAALLAAWNAGGAVGRGLLDGGSAARLLAAGALSEVGGGRLALTALGRLAVKALGADGA